MAGIGFELRKLFDEKGIVANIRACFYSTFIVMGPMLICIITMTLLRFFLLYNNIGHSEVELFMATVTYSYMFSIIITSGIAIILTRYVSDKLYLGDNKDILSSMYGALSISIIIGGLIGFLFYYRSPLDLWYKVCSYSLYMEMIILWIVVIYLSALKDYKRILSGFSIGSLFIVLASLVLPKIEGFNKAIDFVVIMDIGFMIIIVMFVQCVKDTFVDCSDKSLQFLINIDKYPLLFFSNIFFTLGLNIHNIIFWLGKEGVVVRNTFIYAPIYDIPTYYAFLTTIPCMVIFVVKFETSFYEKYRRYYYLINNGGTWKEIREEKKEMVSVIKDEFVFLMEVQLLITTAFLIIGFKIMFDVGLAKTVMYILGVQVLGCYLNAFMFVAILLHYYFVDLKGAFYTSCIFLSSNIVFTYITMTLGEQFYGLGLFVSSLIGLIFALLRLHINLERLDYNTYCSQPVVLKEERGLFIWLFKKTEIYKKNKEVMVTKNDF